MEKSVFFDPNDDEPEICEIESLCLNCGKDGTTRILATKIPFYKEVVVMSFSCKQCGWDNNELQPAGCIQERGVRYVTTVRTVKDLTRLVVKTKSAAVKIPELDFEIVAQEGDVTTVEGIIEHATIGLKHKLENIKDDDPAADSLSEFITKLANLKNVESPFHIEIDDPSGNSFVENFCAPLKDANISVTHYKRTDEQDVLLGIKALAVNDKEDSTTQKEETEENEVKDDVMSFNTNCSLCNASCQTNMKVTKIPHFKEVIIIATTCDYCGHRTSEVKSGSGIEPKGIRIELNVTGIMDMTRDALKSDTCNILIPELKLEVGSYTLGGRFTTLEGLLLNIRDQLKMDNPLVFGDGAKEDNKLLMETFLESLDEVSKGNRNITFILDDPCGNSYLQNIYAPEQDPNMKIIYYERTFEQNEELGLNDMKTENYSSS